MMKIEDRRVVCVWHCPNDKCRELGLDGRREVAFVNPSWYQDNGTPVCHDCGADMVYSHTEVDCG